MPHSMDSFHLSNQDRLMLGYGGEAKEETLRYVVLSILAAILANIFQNTVIYSIFSPILSFYLMHNGVSCLKSPLEQDCIASPAIISLSQATLDTTIFLDFIFGVIAPAWLRHINGLIPYGQNIGQLMMEVTSPGIFLVVKHLISSRGIFWKAVVGIWTWKFKIISIGAGLAAMIALDITRPWLILVLIRSITFTIWFSSLAVSWITKLFNFLISFSTQIDAFGARLVLRFWKPGQYRYRTLQKPDHIRILKVCQRIPFLPLRCELIEAHVDRVHGFEALSYTWSNEIPQHCIIVDGDNLKVTNQVRNILHYRQSFFMASYLWIDAICIDQGDIDERSAQVALMRNVYRGASRVLVWLGLPGEVSEPWKAVTFIISLLAARDQKYTPEDFARFLADSDLADSRVEAVSKLLSHRWFTRSWVIQEVACGCRTHVMYGGVVLHWLDLASAMNIVTHDSLIGRFFPVDPNAKWENFMEQSNGAINVTIIDHLRTKKQQQLGAALYRSRNFDSTLPHDRVFALLGLIDASPRFTIDYRKPFTEVYHEAAIYVLTIEQDHEIFSLAGLGLGKLAFHDVDGAQHPPSWVPDWRVKGNPYPDVFNQYSKRVAHPKYIYGPRFRIHSDNRILHVQGNKIGRIQHLSERLKPSYNLNVFQNSDLLDSISRSADVFRYCSNWIKEAKAMAHQYGRDPYHTSRDGTTEDIDTAFWHTITWDTFDDPADRLSPSEFENLWTHFTWCIPRLEELLTGTSSLSEDEWFAHSQRLVQFINILVTINRGCRFAVTDDGGLCLVPVGATLGDGIYRVAGMQTALVTKGVGDGVQRLVGKGYYHLMGERTEVRSEWFQLR